MKNVYRLLSFQYYDGEKQLLLVKVQEYLDQLSTLVYLTKIDNILEYWQVWVKEKHISKTAFNTQYEKFEFTTMPFGLTNALATFQSIINNIF